MTRGSEVQKKRKCIFSLARAIVFRGMWCNVESVLQHLAHTHILKTHKWSVVRKYLWWSNCMDKYRRITSSISEVTPIYKLWLGTVNFTSRHIKMIIHIRRCQHPCFCGSGSWPMETLTTVVGNTTDPPQTHSTASCQSNPLLDCLCVTNWGQARGAGLGMRRESTRG